MENRYIELCVNILRPIVSQERDKSYLVGRKHRSRCFLFLGSGAWTLWRWGFGAGALLARFRISFSCYKNIRFAIVPSVLIQLERPGPR